jgi:hypothetical protein
MLARLSADRSQASAIPFDTEHQVDSKLDDEQIASLKEVRRPAGHQYPEHVVTALAGLAEAGNPELDEAERAGLVRRLGAARRSVRDAKQTTDLKAEVAAHKAVDEVKRALGERGPVWWKDGSPDLNRHMARNTPYADWYAKIVRSRHGES